MNKNIPPVNYLFMLAYAYEYDWKYVTQDMGTEDMQSLRLFEVEVLMLVLWSKRLLGRNLYKTFQKKRARTQRLRGTIRFGEDMQRGDTHTARLTCEFDEVSHDVLENQIILATLDDCQKRLAQLAENRRMRAKRRKALKQVQKKLRKVHLRLRSQVSLIHLRREHFRKVAISRGNEHYEPIISLCKVLFERSVFTGPGSLQAYGVPENEHSRIFERFLLNYLREAFQDKGMRVKADSKADWIMKPDGGKASHIPAIEPDIVVREFGTPAMVLDAKFYDKAVKGSRYGGDGTNFKTHSENLYQILSYINYYNCDGLLVYAQTERGHFNEEVKISDTYYTDSSAPDNSFGFYTLDVSGGLDNLKESMKELTDGVLTRKVNQ